MPLKPPLLSPTPAAPPVEHDPEVKVARRAARRSLERFERNMDLLAEKIETTGAVTVGWPILKNTFRAVRFVARNPAILAVGGVAVGGYWLYGKMKKSPRAKSRA